MIETLGNIVVAMNPLQLMGFGVIMWHFTSRMNKKIDSQSARTDRLYEMYAEAQKETRDVQKEIGGIQKEIRDLYVEILKEKRS